MALPVNTEKLIHCNWTISPVNLDIVGDKAGDIADNAYSIDYQYNEITIDAIRDKAGDIANGRVNDVDDNQVITAGKGKIKESVRVNDRVSDESIGLINNALRFVVHDVVDISVGVNDMVCDQVCDEDKIRLWFSSAELNTTVPLKLMNKKIIIKSAK